MNPEQSACASSGETNAWEQLDWAHCERNVRRLQARIVKATREGRWGKVKTLQRLLTHSFSGRALAVKRVTENQGRNTPGVDGKRWGTPASRYKAIGTLRRRGYQPLPLRRVYIPKANGKLRPLGILDINLPMVYLNHQQPSTKETFSQWVRFAANHRYNHHVVISPAGYLNELSGTLDQIRLARGSEGQPTDGVSLYSYATYSKGNVPRDTFNSALSKPGGYNKVVAPVFAEAVSTPDMPWKTKPTKGHLKGFVYGANKTNTLDGARIVISGPKNVTTTSDATGFYGAVDLPQGSYEVIASFPGHPPRTNACTISIGKVTTADMTVER